MATGDTPSAVSDENHQVSNGVTKKVTLGDIVTDSFGFPDQLSVSHRYTSGYKLHRCDVS